ncbi:MAG: recombinase RecA [Chloroflexi bacterium]|nr:recombinase RecA [Chloroflexota bacterium]MBT5628337.1 recombinase RecA [Chloroflexota bacterium]
MAVKKATKTVSVNGSASEREKTLELALAQIEKSFGRGAVMRMGESGNNEGIKAVPTGSIALDLALGVGGLPRGRIIEIFGAESAGKTTLAMAAVAEAQAAGGQAAFIDVEHAMDPAYARLIGVDVDKLLISQPDSAEQALEITEYLIRSGALDIIVLDSVAALVPSAELEGDMGDMQIGLQARIMSQALRKLTGIIHKTDTVCIFINQLREKVGVVFGSPEVTPGGRALKFYSSVRIDLRRVEAVKVGQDIIGNRVRARVVKNKVAPPFRKAEMEILFDSGISKEGSLLDLGVDMGIVKKSGSFYSYGDTRLGQGREASRKFLKTNTDIRDEIEATIRRTEAGEAPPEETGETADAPALN